MADARQRDAWDKLSMVLCVFRNSYLGPKQTPFKPSQFNPFHEQNKPIPVSIDRLKEIFLKNAP